MSPDTSSSSSNSGSATPSFSGSEELNLSDIEDLKSTTVENKPQKATKLLPLDKIQTGIQVFVFNVDQGVSMILYDGKDEKILEIQDKNSIIDLNFGNLDPIFIYYTDNHFQAIIPNS